MRTRIVNTLAIAVAMALPVAGAAAAGGGADTQADAQVDAGAGADAAGVEVGVEVGASAQVHAGVTVPPLTVPPADLPPLDLPPVDVPPLDVPPVDLPQATTASPERPTTHERSSDQPQRETFRVRDAGQVTVAWVPDAIVEVEAHPNRGWRHDLHRQDRRTAHVRFTDGQRTVLFSAHVTEDGRLRTHIAERGDPARQPTTETFRVRDAGTVTITYSPRGIHDVQVEPNEGWDHRVHRAHDRRTVRVGFWNGERGYVFTAHVTKDGQLRTHVDDHPRTQDRATDRATDPATDPATDGATTDTTTRRDHAA